MTHNGTHCCGFTPQELTLQRGVTRKIGLFGDPGCLAERIRTRVVIEPGADKRRRSNRGEVSRHLSKRAVLNGRTFRRAYFCDRLKLGYSSANESVISALSNASSGDRTPDILRTILPSELNSWQLAF
jgi:hypothetical protein